MSRSWAKGSTRAWRRTRAAVLLRDQGMCRLRIPSICIGTATHVHHTLGRKVTGDDPRYLIASCAPCNLHVGEPAASCDPQPRPRTEW